jgi:hypothetical protein
MFIATTIQYIYIKVMARQKGKFHRCWGSVTFWCGFGSPDPYNVTYGSIYFLQYLPNFKEVNKKTISFFSYNLPTGTLSSVLKM